jgi:hypothetical protein
LTDSKDGAQYDTLGYIKNYLGVNANIVCRLVASKVVRTKTHAAAYPKYCVDDIRTYIEEQGHGTTPRKPPGTPRFSRSATPAIPIEPATAARKATAPTK